MTTNIPSPDPEFTVVEANDVDSVQKAIDLARVTGSSGATHRDRPAGSGDESMDRFATVKRIPKE